MTLIDAIQTVWGDMTSAFATVADVNTLVWLATTVMVYALSLQIFRYCGGQPLLHPLILTTAGMAGVLAIIGVEIDSYQSYAQLLHWLLGPATVALALPLYNNWHFVKMQGWRLLIAVMVGGIVAPLLAWIALVSFNTPLSLEMTMLAKSITTPFAMETVNKIQGVPALAAVFVITTGIVGAMASQSVFRLLRVDDKQAQGLALGTVAHAVGTAKAIQMNETTGAMATVGLCVNGIMTSIILPITLG